MLLCFLMMKLLYFSTGKSLVLDLAICRPLEVMTNIFKLFPPGGRWAVSSERRVGNQAINNNEPVQIPNN